METIVSEHLSRYGRGRCRERFLVVGPGKGLTLILKFPMSATRVTSLLENGLLSSIRSRYTTPKIRSRRISQTPKPGEAGELDGFSPEELIQPDFSRRNKWVVPKRTLFYVPGSSQKMIDKAWSLEVDNIVRPFRTPAQLELILRLSTLKILYTHQKRPRLAI